MSTFQKEPVHYTSRDRRFWNNGMRRLWLHNGKETASVVNAARRGEFDVVLAHVKTLGGVSGGTGIARDIMRAAQKLDADVSGHKIERDTKGGMRVYTLTIRWVFRGKRDRQAGVIEWKPMFSVKGRK